MELKKSSSVFVMGHNEPDFDAIGSAFGLYVWAVQNDKNAYYNVNDTIDKSRIQYLLDPIKERFEEIKHDTNLFISQL